MNSDIIISLDEITFEYTRRYSSIRGMDSLVMNPFRVGVRGSSNRPRKPTEIEIDSLSRLCEDRLMPFARVSTNTTLTSKSLFWQAIPCSLLATDALECAEARFTYRRPWTWRGLAPFLAKRQEPAKPLTLAWHCLGSRRGRPGKGRPPLRLMLSVFTTEAIHFTWEDRAYYYFPLNFYVETRDRYHYIRGQYRWPRI